MATNWEVPRDLDSSPGRVHTELSAQMFATLARNLLAEAARRRIGARIDFRSPPKGPDMVRSVTPRGDGSFCIAVTLRGRNAHAVAGDMIEGIMHVAGEGHHEDAFDRLWDVASELLDPLCDGKPMGEQ